MLGGFAIIPLTLILITSNPFQGLEATAPGFWNPFTKLDGDTLGLLTYVSALGWGLGGFGSLRLLARFMAMEDERHIPRSTYITVGLGHPHILLRAVDGAGRCSGARRPRRGPSRRGTALSGGLVGLLPPYCGWPAPDRRGSGRHEHRRLAIVVGFRHRFERRAFGSSGSRSRCEPRGR